jgi:2-oxoglutarate dehydrogenase complex dehydrogenase (E1) component-like enzyme
MSRIRNTGVGMDILKSCGQAITALPETFTPHRQIKKIYEARAGMIEQGGCPHPGLASSGAGLAGAGAVHAGPLVV